MTGLRFVKIDKVLYLQIQEGVLSANGQINPRSLKWKDVDKKAPKYLMSYENRRIDLDDIRVPAQRVLTGTGTLKKAYWKRSRVTSESN